MGDALDVFFIFRLQGHDVKIADERAGEDNQDGDDFPSQELEQAAFTHVVRPFFIRGCVEGFIIRWVSQEDCTYTVKYFLLRQLFRYELTKFLHILGEFQNLFQISAFYGN